MSKVCQKCSFIKSFEEFYNHKHNRDGKANVCKECQKQKEREKYNNNKEKKLEYQREYQRKNSDKVSQYYKEYYNKNYDEILEYSKNYYHENKEDAASRSKHWREKNKDKIKQYRENNKEHINQLSRESKRKRRQDPIYRLRERISNSVRKMLKKMNNTSKNTSSILKFLPYSPEELKNHLESQFSPEMTWDNYGTLWEIDHIYPQSLLPFSSLDDDNFLLCWGLNNLRPLLSIENKQKSNKILTSKET